MPFRPIVGLYRRFHDNQPLQSSPIKIKLSANDYDLEAGYPVEEITIITTETGALPNGFSLWANAEGYAQSQYVVTEPDGFKWQFVLPGGESEISLQELRAGGMPVTMPDTIISLIEDTPLNDLADVEFGDLADGDAVVWDATKEKFVNLSLNTPKQVDVTGTNHTLTAADNGKIINFQNAGANSLIVNSNLGAQFNVGINVEPGAGEVTLSGTATIQNRQGHTKIFTNGFASLFSYAADNLRFQGDTKS